MVVCVACVLLLVVVVRLDRLVDGWMDGWFSQKEWGKVKCE